MNRIEERLAALKEEGKKAFITYTTAGLPDYDTTKKIMSAQEKAGIDIMEIGVPFSDPIADGPVIQDASFKAIQNGASLEGTFTMMGEVRKAGLNSPVVFMLYYNTVYHYGVENFVNKCIENGVDGLIIPDLPFEEQGEIKDVLAKNEKSPILIQLVSPVSKGRIPMLLENARGFVYCVSQMGVTGKGANFHSQIREYLTEVKKESKIPVMMGFEQQQMLHRLKISLMVQSLAHILSSFLKLIIIQRKLPQIMLQHLRRSLMHNGTYIS
jgi:tryptophan synthase alpha chain